LFRFELHSRSLQLH